MDGEQSATISVAPSDSELKLEAARSVLATKIDGRTSGKYARILLAALSGIPWVGSLLSAAATFTNETEQEQVSELQRLWLQEHQEKLQRLGQTLNNIISRFDELGDELQARIQSEEYLRLVRRGFRSWDQADTEEKRDLVRKLLTNAGGNKLCPDDLVRLFISWIDFYHESHFAVIREVHRNPGATRGEIWRVIDGSRVAENSAEADLFRLLVRDLSTGGVIRQHRQTNGYGQFTKKARAPSQPSGTLKSAFDEQEEYELTELGAQFVHYTMNELVARVGAAT